MAGQTVIQKLQQEPLGREMLAFTGINPVRALTATISFDDPGPQELLPDAGSLIVDAKVLVDLSFNAGTSNAILFSTGSALVPNPPKSVFANAYNVGVAGGAAVTGFTVGEADTPQFLPVAIAPNVAVFVAYAQTGTPATTGKAYVVISYIALNPDALA